ncbi:MAG: SDR family oxidoreductase [Bacteroidia bacterium]
MNVSNKTIVVTGGGNGMGREMTLLLLSKGARVAAVDLSEKNLQETADLAKIFGKQLSIHVANITDRQAVEGLPQQIIAAHGQIDGLINNAGIIQPFVKVNDLEYTAIERVMNVNFYGLIYMTKTFLPYLLKCPEAHIVNISSMGGFLPVPGQSIYGASKAAVKLLTEGLRSELLDTNVKVTIVFPGAIATNIAANSGLKIEMPKDAKQSEFKSMPADKAAQLIIAGMENNKYRVLVGSDASFMDFLYRLNPKFAAEFIYKKMKSLLSMGK